MLSISVPPLGESIVEATVSRWLRNEGDHVSAGETLVELETDKVTVEVPALKAGVLARRARQEGDVVKVGDLLGELDETAAPVGVPSGSGAGAQPAAAPDASRPPSPTAQPLPVRAGQPSAPPAAADGTFRASPAATRTASERGVDLAGITPGGRGGVISKPDVIEQSSAAPAAAAPAATLREAPPAAPPPEVAPREAPAVAAPAAAPAPTRANDEGSAARETREKMSTRRRRIAEHLLESQHATAHLTTFNEIDLTAVESLRGRIRERIEKEHGVRVSMMPFFVKAACQALRQYPVVNARVDGDHIVYHHYVNMGIAVASDAGLVVPNIRNADGLGMIDIAKAISEVARRARDGKLNIDDLTGGTFTITNGGVFGSLVSTPIINFPQAGILGLHKVQDRPVAINGQVVIRPMMYVALSYDHRIIDGQQAVLFLVRVRELMEDPGLMAVD
ncbi:MAG: 2-oxoglutarate dehydrogenase complex dihydrolipoyllysine-residue succinyltransferase [Gemmatimonadota bacterium]